MWLFLSNRIKLLGLAYLSLTVDIHVVEGGLGVPPPQKILNIVDAISSILVDFVSLIPLSGFTIWSIKKLK